MNETHKKPYQKAKTLSILSANCLNQLSPLANCHTCETVCPQKVLSFQDGKWSASNCTLCGVCTMVCPTQVFQIDAPHLLQLPAQALVLTCSQHSSAPAEALRINCIQQLNPLAIIHLLYRHPSVRIYLPLEHCKQCSHHWYAQGLLQQLKSYQLPAEKLQVITELSNTPAEENQRRDLFRDLFHRTEDTSKKMLVQAVEKIGAEFSSEEIQQQEPAVFPNRLPLYALYVKKQLPVPSDTELPFRRLICTACTFCSACTHVCPTEALILKASDDNQKQLYFQPELCINCNLCSQICMQHGLEWDDFFTAEQFMQTPQLLAHADKQICSRCEHEFYQWPLSQDNDTESLCSFCK